MLEPRLVLASEFTWDGESSSIWNFGLNWDPNAPAFGPESLDTAIFDSNVNDPVTLSAAAEVAALQVDDASVVLDLKANNLTVSGTLSVVSDSAGTNHLTLTSNDEQHQVAKLHAGAVSIQSSGPTATLFVGELNVSTVYEADVQLLVAGSITLAGANTNLDIQHGAVVEADSLTVGGHVKVTGNDTPLFSALDIHGEIQLGGSGSAGELRIEENAEVWATTVTVGKGGTGKFVVDGEGAWLYADHVTIGDTDYGLALVQAGDGVEVDHATLANSGDLTVTGTGSTFIRWRNDGDSQLCGTLGKPPIIPLAVANAAERGFYVKSETESLTQFV
jgi:hypothetical protein